MEFSKPKQDKPIPEGTVRVDFKITLGDEEDQYFVEFQFENESLIHRLDHTMRTNMFQVSAPST